MWLRALLILLFLPFPALASTVANINCQETDRQDTTCQIQLAGEVQVGERLFLTNVLESDVLYWNKIRLGATGMIFDQPISAGVLPRLYSLQPLLGQQSPALTMKIHAIFADKASIPKQARVRVVDGRYPLFKVFASLVFPILSFLLLFAGCVYFSSRLEQQTIDGWMYPREELRWFSGSLLVYLLLDHNITKIFVPVSWTLDVHVFVQRLALFTCIWSLAGLLTNGRFSDRSCVERGLSRPESKPLARVLSGTFLLSLYFLAASSRMPSGLFFMTLTFLSAVVLYCGSVSAAGTEWKRILKRSGLSPLLFHFSLHLFSCSVFAMALGSTLGLFDGSRLFYVSAWLVVATNFWRLQKFHSVQTRSRSLGQECRKILQAHSSASRRLHALCGFIEQEWGAARVSVISVEGSQGLVLASAGPDAIQVENRHQPRKLGPFLRRVCKEGHILYAPVAEELGKDLQEKGWRHSSVAIPFLQERKVRAVLCIMADEGARIDPVDATLMELLCDALGLEILSGVAQHVAEEKNERLLLIARNAGGLAVEHMDGWGHLHFSKNEEARFIVGAQADPDPAYRDSLQRSPTFSKLLASYELELRSIWTALAESFEFLPKEMNGDFWVLSPREFRQPFLQSLGAERAALALGQAMERSAKQLLTKPCFLALGINMVKIVVGHSQLRFVSYGTAESGSVDVDAGDFALLQRIREEASGASFLFWGEDPTSRLADSRFDCRACPALNAVAERVYSIFSVCTDKKEIRKIESRASEQAKIYVKRAA
jgi:hypothetical protein